MHEHAILAGGCFWCLEAVFDELEGVLSVESGYIGGRRPHPTYEQICSGATGHAEAVRITFDPAVLSFEDLLDVFFAIHDPTTLNRQGNDVGSQYRSAIFYTSPAQKEAAERKLLEVEGAVTEVTQASEFYVAEAYHQEYFVNNRANPYCQFVVSPKVQKFRTKFANRRKSL